MDEPLLTTKAAAALLGISPRTLDRWRWTGDSPPFRRVGRRAVRYHPADIRAYLQARKRKSTSDPGPNPPNTIPRSRVEGFKSLGEVLAELAANEREP